MSDKSLKVLAISTILALSSGIGALSAGGNQSRSDQGIVSEPAEISMQAGVHLNNGNLEFYFGQNADMAVLRVSGPEYYTLSLRARDSDMLTANLSKDANVSFLDDDDPARDIFWSDLPNGEYSFELMVYTPDGLRHTTRGYFRVRNGTADTEVTLRDPFGEDFSMMTPEQGWLARAGSSVLDFFIPTAQAQQFDDWINIRDSSDDDHTRINMRQTNDAFDNLSIHNYRGSFRVNQGTGTSAIGDEVFMISSEGKMGLGTSNPQAVLHLNLPDQPFNSILMDSTRGAWQIDTGGLIQDLGFRIRDLESGRTPFRIDSGAPGSSIRVSSDGNIGVGTSAPDHSITVQRDDGSARVVVSDTEPTDSQQMMFELAAEGNPQFRFSNNATDKVWNFRTQDYAECSQGTTCFVINKRRGPRFIFTEDGDMFIEGSYEHSSSETVKQAIEPLDESEIIRRISNVGIHEWSYTNNPDIRHIGPMAEEFYAAFGLGSSERSISASNMAGLGLAGIQALEARNRELEERLAKLEKMITTQL